jgi:23S rRNA (adenine2503-C2)-methyltransferase
MARRPPRPRSATGRRTSDRALGRHEPPVARRPTRSRVSPQPDLPPQSLLRLYRPDISDLVANSGWPDYRYAQVCEHLFHRSLRPFSEATSLPADFRAFLDGLGVSTLVQLEARTAADGTSKLLLAGSDNMAVETVLMRYRSGTTVCVSSQVGCAVGCRFCATGGMGFGRNLACAEIVDQVRAAGAVPPAERVSNVVFMGMGEPLLNLRAVVDSIRVLTDPNGLGIAQRAISVSTVGIPNGMVRLGRLEPQVNLALSLHAPNDETRSLLVPTRYRHPIAEILDAAWEHFALTRRKLLVEYVLLRDINDSAEHAHGLAQLLRGHVVTVNLLAWNPVSRGSAGESQTTPPLRFQPSSQAAVAKFRDTLAKHHIEAVVRRSKGGAIQGACGQLAGKRSGCGMAPRKTGPEQQEPPA